MLSRSQSSLDVLGLRFPSRRVFITGAASGLGKALLSAFVDAGWSVAALDRDAHRLEAVAAGNVTVTTFAVDVRDDDAVRDAVKAYHQAGGLDVLVNNAGVAVAGEFADVSLDDWRWVFDTNVMGQIHGCRAALPLMHAKHAGLIVNVASAAAFLSSPAMAPYNMSKAAILSFSETLAGELQRTGITISVALPAFFETNLLKTLRAPDVERESARLLMRHSGYTVEEACADILFGMARKEFYILAPRRLAYLWRYKRWLPHRFLRRFPGLRERRLTQLRTKDG